MHDDEPIDPDEVRYVLRRVAAYREVCERVRKGSTGSLIFGGIMLAIWQWALPENLKFEWFGIVYLALAILEFGRRCQYLLIDEFQDVSQVQYQLIKALNSQHITTVCDPRQSIYSWRGSGP